LGGNPEKTSSLSGRIRGGQSCGSGKEIGGERGLTEPRRETTNKREKDRLVEVLVRFKKSIGVLKSTHREESGVDVHN